MNNELFTDNSFINVFINNIGKPKLIFMFIFSFIISFCILKTFQYFYIDEKKFGIIMIIINILLLIGFAIVINYPFI